MATGRARQWLAAVQVAGRAPSAVRVPSLPCGVVDAWVGVIGTLLGAIVGAGGTFLIERWRARREDRQRFTADRRMTYGRLLISLDSASRAIDLMLAEPLDAERGDVLTSPASAAMDAFGEIELIGTEPVRSAAIRLREALSNMLEAALQPGAASSFAMPGGPYLVAYDAFHERRSDFLEACRQELGLSDLIGR